MTIPQDKAENTGSKMRGPITSNDDIIPETVKTPPEAPIKTATSKILEPKYDKVQKCDGKDCPIKTKEILFGMHCVFYKNKTYHAFCARMLKLDFKVQQPALRPTEAK